MSKNALLKVLHSTRTIQYYSTIQQQLNTTKDLYEIYILSLVLFVVSFEPVVTFLIWGRAE